MKAGTALLWQRGLERLAKRPALNAAARLDVLADELKRQAQRRAGRVAERAADECHPEEHNRVILAALELRQRQGRAAQR